MAMPGASVPGRNGQFSGGGGLEHDRHALAVRPAQRNRADAEQCCNREGTNKTPHGFLLCYGNKWLLFKAFDNSIRRCPYHVIAKDNTGERPKTHSPTIPKTDVARLRDLPK
jgi:hypothetical protein